MDEEDEAKEFVVQGMSVYMCKQSMRLTSILNNAALHPLPYTSTLSSSSSLSHFYLHYFGLILVSSNC